MIGSISSRKPEPFKSLVEDRRAFTFCHSELNLYETRQAAEKVSLFFGHPVLAIMLKGKKQMYMPDGSFPFLPGQSLIMQGNASMVIDFPEASIEQPTACLALEISKDLVNKTLDLLNERQPKAEENQIWQLEKAGYHFPNSPEIYGAAHRLFELYHKHDHFSEHLEYLTLQELVLRILQTQARNLLLVEAAMPSPSSRMAQALAYIEKHLNEDINVDSLSSMVCMSKPHFFRCFKAEVGVPPVVYIHQEKIKLACRELSRGNRSIGEVAWSVGFANLGYFSRVFKKMMGVSPGEWKSGRR